MRRRRGTGWTGSRCDGVWWFAARRISPGLWGGLEIELADKAGYYTPVELENRAREATLEFGGALSPAALRMLCCDARVIPVVLGRAGQPLDVGLASRTATEPIRRANTGGLTAVRICVMVCKTCHRLIHHAGWTCRIRDGQPEFIPPKWIDHNNDHDEDPPPS